jgi:hypothetical protein
MMMRRLMWRFLSGDGTTRQGFSSEITAWIGILRANLSAKQKRGFAISRIRGYRRRGQGAAARAGWNIDLQKTSYGSPGNRHLLIPYLAPTVERTWSRNIRAKRPHSAVTRK